MPMFISDLTTIANALRHPVGQFGNHDGFRQLHVTNDFFPLDLNAHRLSGAHAPACASWKPSTAGGCQPPPVAWPKCQLARAAAIVLALATALIALAVCLAGVRRQQCERRVSGSRTGRFWALSAAAGAAAAAAARSLATSASRFLRSSSFQPSPWRVLQLRVCSRSLAPC